MFQNFNYSAPDSKNIHRRIPNDISANSFSIFFFDRFVSRALTFLVFQECHAFPEASARLTDSEYIINQIVCHVSWQTSTSSSTILPFSTFSHNEIIPKEATFGIHN